MAATAAHSCAPIETDLDLPTAQAILEPFFLALQIQFLEAGLKRCRSTRFRVAKWVHDSPRHFGATEADGSQILVAPEMAELPIETVSGILSHELGHAIDFLYPGEWVLGREREALRRSRRDVDTHQWERWLRAWKARDDDVVEMTADAIVEWALGRRVGYLGPCMLQSFDRGVPRPVGLK